MAYRPSAALLLCTGSCHQPPTHRALLGSNAGVECYGTTQHHQALHHPDHHACQEPFGMTYANLASNAVAHRTIAPTHQPTPCTLPTSTAWKQRQAAHTSEPQQARPAGPVA